MFEVKSIAEHPLGLWGFLILIYSAMNIVHRITTESIKKTRFDDLLVNKFLPLQFELVSHLNLSKEHAQQLLLNIYNHILLLLTSGCQDIFALRSIHIIEIVMGWVKKSIFRFFADILCISFMLYRFF